MWRSLGPSLAKTPERARELAEVVLHDALAHEELGEAILLTVDEDRWKSVKAYYREVELARTGMVKTGTFFDELEAETGGAMTAEAIEAFMARKRGAPRG